MMRCIETGRNPTMRYIHRTHRVSVSWLHERFTDPLSQLQLVYEVSNNMCADVYTKIFTDSCKWVHACRLINVFDPAVFLRIAADGV
eukprot:11209869-Lingulodinium_polyedra.AAC.1